MSTSSDGAAPKDKVLGMSGHRKFSGKEPVPVAINAAAAAGLLHFAQWVSATDILNPHEKQLYVSIVIVFSLIDSSRMGLVT